MSNRDSIDKSYICDETNPLANGAFGYVIACSSDEPNKKIVLKLPLTNLTYIKKGAYLKLISVRFN